MLNVVFWLLSLPKTALLPLKKNMHSLRNIHQHILASAFFLLFLVQQGMSQCSMCKASAATKGEGGSYFMGTGLNTGILFLLALPFLLCAFVGYKWYRKNKMKQELEA